MKHKSSEWTKEAVFRNCPLCGADETITVSQRMQHHLDLTTVMCSRCSLVYTNPIPPAEVCDRFYAEAYSQYYGQISPRPEGHLRSEEPYRVRSRVQKIEAVRPLTDVRLLEVGPGQGLFLWWAQKRGCSVLGVEPSIDFYNSLTQDGLPCVHALLEQVEPEQVGRFDVIYMAHVLEHFYDPNVALQRCRDLLEDDGILVIEVPNIYKPFRSLDRYFLRYVHATNFSPQTLQAMLEKNGLSPVVVDEGKEDEWRSPQHLFVIARKATSDVATTALPQQSMEEVLSTLRSYRTHWVRGGGLKWHLWNTAKQRPALLRNLRRARLARFIGH